MFDKLISAIPCQRRLSKCEVQSLGGSRRHCESLKGIGGVVPVEIPTMSNFDSTDSGTIFACERFAGICLKS